MFFAKREKTPMIVTTHNLGKIILDKKIVPTPIYTSGREMSYIAQLRGTIFSRARRGKASKF